MDLKNVLEQPVTFRKKVFKIGGNKISVLNPEGKLVAFIKQKAFKLKEDIRVYSDTSLSEEVLYIQARKVLDISATYDVTDQTTSEKIGALRRQGLASTFVRDTWEMLDTNEKVVGTIAEDSTALALIRRYLNMGGLIPQSFSFSSNGMELAVLKQRFNPFIFKSDLTIKDKSFDPRLAMAGAVLLMCIEGRQS